MGGGGGGVKKSALAWDSDQDSPDEYKTKSVGVLEKRHVLPRDEIKFPFVIPRQFYLALLRVRVEPLRRLTDGDLRLLVHLRRATGRLRQRHGGAEANPNLLLRRPGSSLAPCRRRVRCGATGGSARPSAVAKGGLSYARRVLDLSDAH